jgi:hypothetical protein
MSKLSVERAIGRAILSDPLIAKALAGFAASEWRRPPNAASYMVMLGLESLGWLEYSEGWKEGPTLGAFLSREYGPERMDLDLCPGRPRPRFGTLPQKSTAPMQPLPETGNVFPFRPSLAAVRPQAGLLPAAPTPIPPAG